jgi:hypothetical protein
MGCCCPTAGLIPQPPPAGRPASSSICACWHRRCIQSSASTSTSTSASASTSASTSTSASASTSASTSASASTRASTRAYLDDVSHRLQQRRGLSRGALLLLLVLALSALAGRLHAAHWRVALLLLLLLLALLLLLLLLLLLPLLCSAQESRRAYSARLQAMCCVAILATDGAH